MRTGFDTIAGMVSNNRPVASAILGDGHGRVQIKTPSEAFHYTFTPEDTKQIAIASTVAAAEESKTVVLLGGPKHGDTLPYHPGKKQYRFPFPPTSAYVTADSYYPPQMKESVYIATDTAMYVPQAAKFCWVYEHDSLGKANVRLRAKELDQLIRVTSAQLGTARNSLDEVQAKLKELNCERHELALVHGV